MSGAVPIAINARAALRDEIGGVERWARELAERLPALAPGRYRVVRPHAKLAFRAGHAWEQALLPLSARGAELILSPANTAPALSRRNAVIVHDAAPLREPAWFGRTYGAWHRTLLPRIARGARLVIVPSRFAATELVELARVDPARIRVVPPGVDPRFSPGVDPEPARSRYGLARPYVLGLGTESARKNLALLDRLAPALQADGVDVVLAGSTRGYLATGAREGGEDAPGRARRLGFVPDALLPSLLRGAAALAMPSLYEGFGLPCLEAMACGTPVVAADRTALPEACAGAALLADPADERAFADALRAALEPREAERLAAAGRERAAGFTWERTAREVDAALAATLAERAG